MKLVLMKKAQITLFVIMGLIILALIIALLNIKPKIQESEKIGLASFEQTKKTFEEYMDLCLESTTDKAINRYGLEYIEEQVEYYIENHLAECMGNFDEFKEKGYDVIFSKPKINITISGKNVETLLDADIELLKEDKKATFNEFTSVLNYPYDFQDPKKEFEWKYRGILYDYEETTEPRPLQMHILKIDLEDPTLAFIVTPKLAPDLMITSLFLESNNVQVAVNGGGFDIGGTNEVNGYAAYKGVAYSYYNISPGETIFVTKDNKISIGESIPSEMQYAVSGFNHIIIKGKILDRFLYKDHPDHDPGYDLLHPRTSIGLDENENWLILIVIDGRNPGISEGVSAKELGEIHLKYGTTDLVNMDGGGSTTLVMVENNIPKVLNTPSDGHERPVANHFGIYAKKMPDLLI